MAARYVDNLFTVQTRPLPSFLTNSTMYGETVVLEFEPGNEFLGTRVLTNGNALQMEYVVHGFEELMRLEGYQATTLEETPDAFEQIINRLACYLTNISSA